MSVFALEWFEKEANHIELAEDQKSFHYSLLLPNDNNQAETYSGEIVFTTEERYGLIMRQFLEDVLLGENTDVFKGYVARRILGGHNNNQTAYELFNKERREDFVETPNILDTEQLHDLFIRFGGENAEELFKNFIKLSEGKRYVDAELKQWLKDRLPNLFRPTDTMAWVARWELLNATLVLGRFTDDPTQMPIVTHGDYRITPEWYCYYVAIRRIFDSQYRLWEAQAAAGRIQFQHFVREKYEPSFGRGVVFYSYDILTSKLYSIVFDFLIDNSVSMSLRLGVSDYLKKAGADCPDFLQYLDHEFEPYRNTAGSSMSFSLLEKLTLHQDEQILTKEDKLYEDGLYWPTDSSFKEQITTRDSHAFYRNSKLGASTALNMSVIHDLYLFLVEQGKLEKSQENLMLLTFRLTGKTPYALDTNKVMRWLGPRSDYSLCYFVWYLFTTHDGRFWTKTGRFFCYANGDIYDGMDEQTRRQDFSKGRDQTDPFAIALRDVIGKLIPPQQE